MTSSKHRLAALAAAVTLGGSALVAGTPTLASAVSPGDAVLKHASASDRSRLTICKDWSGTSSDPGCKEGSPLGYLERGQNSKTKYRWADTDGFVLPAGYNATISGGGYPSYRISSTGWHKLGGSGGLTRTVDLWRE